MMASKQKRDDRKAMVTKALLLGYTIEWDFEDEGFFLRCPDGRRYLQKDGSTSIWVHWPAPWLAARQALELSGVPDETDVPRDLGIGSSKGWRLRGGRDFRGHTKGLFKVSRS